MILLQMHLVAPSNPNLVSERLIDTLIGAAVATVFSFVLANWEYQSLPRLIRQVLNVNLSYMQASFELLQGKCNDDFRLPHRAQAPDGQPGRAQLGAGAHARRAGQQAARGGRHQSVYRAELPAGGACGGAALDPGPPRQRAAGGARQCPARRTAIRKCARPCRARWTSSTTRRPSARRSRRCQRQRWPMSSWSGWPLVQRRIRLLQADADKIVVHSAAIVHIVTPRKLMNQAKPCHEDVTSGRYAAGVFPASHYVKVSTHACISHDPPPATGAGHQRRPRPRRLRRFRP